MLVLVYGSNGWIGSQFIELFENNNIKYVIGVSRVDDNDNLTQEIEKYNPTHVVSLIGRTHGTIDNKVYSTIDYLEQKGKLVENIRDNLYGPLILALICSKKNIHLTYLGTGCIFTYDESLPQNDKGFNEDDIPNFFGSSYSVVKGFTDKIMHLFDDHGLNLRIRMPIDNKYNQRNFITKITNYKKICSISNSMTVLPELLPIAVDLIKNKTTGTINLTNPGVISHNEILELYKKIVDPSFEWENFTQEEQRQILDSERSNNLLDTNKLETLYPQVLNITDAVTKCLHQYKNHLDIIKNKKLELIIPSMLEHDVNLLITGGCGFIGSNFINYYFPKNIVKKLVNIDALYYCANENNVNDEIRNDQRYHFVNCNLCDYQNLKDTIVKHDINYIIHFAAQSHVDNSFINPSQFIHDNIIGTHNLLEIVKNYCSTTIKKFIYVSTDEVYGESLNTIDEKNKTEESLLAPTNPYAATKASAELLAQSYFYSFSLPIVITRGNNVYGKNQYPEKLIPKFIKLLKENKKVTIQGDGSSKRSFLHVDDAVKAFQIILERSEIGEIYNIGCDENMEYSVLDIAKFLIKIIKNTNNYDQWIEYIKDRPYNDQRYYISNRKLKNLNWDINIGIFSGLQNMI